HRPTHPTYWLQTPSVEFFLPPELAPEAEARREIANSGFRIGIQAGCLALVVVYWPQPAWPLAIWPEIHEPLWPPKSSLTMINHRYEGEVEPWNVNSHLFLYRMLDTIGAIAPGIESLRLAVRKNRNVHVSGPEPDGPGDLLPIPAVITPEIDRQIREWLSAR